MNKKNLQARAHQSKGFKYSLIASAIIGLSSATTYAAEEEVVAPQEEELEVIQVTGQRGNLISAQNMKMDADTVMDALSAADMGSLADRSVLEAISRLPGVAIERFAASDDPDHFGVEGGGVVVRGLTHVRSEFNGRDSFSADSGRGLGFQDVSPELMGSVEVFKNQTADMIEGGIAGTVNLNTRKAFDAAGRVFAFSADATYTDMREEFSPTFSALYSDIWETDAGRFGFLANFSHSEIQVESHGVQSGRFREQNRDASLLVPESVRLTQKQDDKDRDGFATSLQWENNEGTLQLTAEYIKSSASLAWGENAIEMQDGDVLGTLLPVEGTEFDFSDTGTFENGIITSEAGWRGDGSPSRYGMQHANVTRIRNEESDVNDFSFNAKYNPNDNLSLNFDVQYIDSTMEVLDVSVMGATRAVVGLDLRGSGLPDVSLYGPGFDNQAEYASGTPFLDPSTNFWRSAMDHIQDNEGEEFATRLDAEYTFDNGIIKSVEVGARYSDREQTTRQSTYNWAVLSEAWTGGGNVWFDDTDVPYEQISFEDFSRGGVLTTEGGNEFLFPSLDMVKNYDGLSDALANARPNGSWQPLADRDGAEGNFTGNEINVTEEINTAFYAKVNFEGDFSGMDYSANIGVRYVKLENTTQGFLSFPDNVVKDENDVLNQVLAPDQSAFGNFASSETQATSEYTNVLPSVNFKLNLTDELLLRFGFSEAIALPDLGLLRNYVSISGEDPLQVTYDSNVPDGDQPIPVYAEYPSYKASSGNPDLQPMESYNYDLSLEWYFAEAGSLTTSLFYKDLSNYFIKGTVFENYTNNGVTKEVAVGRSLNADEGKIQGIEVAYQQFFDALPGAFSGLGVQLNYTHIDEEGSPNSGLNNSSSNSDDASDIAFTDLPLEGLSEQNANAALLYEKYGISARIAYNWRSDYLLTTRDVITFLPIYNEAGGQLDASLFWDVSDSWKVGVQGTNLNNNITETQAQINQEGDRVARSWFTNDRRYSVVVRATF